ncbi:MAG: hypothetical protein ACXVWU_03400 [Nocardioides sp.]
MADSDPTGPAPAVPAQRTSRDEARRLEAEKYAESARHGDLAALLAPYHG